jgi:hypothetical protein
MAGDTLGTIAYHIVYASFVENPVDLLEQIVCEIYGVGTLARTYRQQLVSSYLKTTLLTSTHAAIFSEQEEMIRFKLLQIAIDNFAPDFGARKESLIQMQIASAKAQQSFDLYRLAIRNALENRLQGPYESPLSKLRIRTALVFDSSNFNVYLVLLLPSLGFITALIFSARTISKERAPNGGSMFTRIFYLSLRCVGDGTGIFFGELYLAVLGRSDSFVIQLALLLFSFAVGLWVSQAGTFTTIL